MQYFLIKLCLLFFNFEHILSQTITTISHQINGATLPYQYYYNVNKNQTININIISNCIHIHHRVKDSKSKNICGKGDEFLENLAFSCSLINNQNYYFYAYVYQQRSSICNWTVVWNQQIVCPVGCNYCPDQHLCTNCMAGYYLYFGVCYRNYPFCTAMNSSNLSKCANCITGYTLTLNGTCKSCTGNVRHCSICTGLICNLCWDQYFLKSITNQCILCADPIPGCLRCPNQFICNTCAYDYHLPSTGVCVKCSDVLPGCLTCSNLTTCTQCFDRSYQLLPDFTCQKCDVTIPHCTVCLKTTVNKCYDCQIGWAANIGGTCSPQSSSQYGAKCFVFSFYNHSLHYTCTSCGVGYSSYAHNSTLKYCVKCAGECVLCPLVNGASTCTLCLPGYLSDGWTCRKCNTTMPQCLNCTSFSVCIKCEQPISLLISSKCPLCSALLPFCIHCIYPLSPICTLCVTNQYAIAQNKTQCILCSTFMRECIECDDRSVCTLCNNGFTVHKQICFECYYFLKNCTSCSDISTCLTCQVGYALSNLSKCLPCSSYMANCQTCSTRLVCTTCKPSYALVNNTCMSCSLAHRKCRQCDNLTTCTQCYPYWFTQNDTCIRCRYQINLCSTCDNSSVCNQCLMNAVFVNGSKCQCAPGYYEVNHLCIDDPFCISAIQDGQKVECKCCDYFKHTILNSAGVCVCRPLYILVNGTCIQKCGDGVLITLECDDGNLQEHDGCSSTCQIQQDFVCYSQPYNMSVCKLALHIKFNLYYTQKVLSQNKAFIYLTMDSKNPNILKYYKADYYKIQMLTNRNQSLILTNYFRSQQYYMVLEIQYNETIEDSELEIYYTFSQERVLEMHEKMTIKLNGINYPLVISAYTSHFQLIYKIQEYLMIAYYCILLVLLLSDKFIAVQCLTTIQLIYFSQILIFKNKNYMQSFITLLPLKYSNGLDYFINQNYTYQNLINSRFSEFRYLMVGESFLMNNLINISILALLFIVFVVLFIIKNPKEKTIVKIKQTLQEKKILSQQIGKIRPWYKKLYQSIFNLSYSILAEIVVSLFVQNSFLRNSFAPFIVNSFDKFCALIFFGLVIIIILQIFWHIFLSFMEVINQRYMVHLKQTLYRKVFLLNFLVNIILIVIFNNKLVFGCPISLILVVVALVYLAFIVIFKPYGYSYTIHQATIIIHQVLYLIVLTIFTAINFEIKIKEQFFLVFSYFMMFSISLMVFLSLIRCYLWYKYNQALIKAQIQRQINQLRNQTKKYVKKTDIEEYDINNRKRNKFIYENQVLKYQQINYLNQLKYQKNFLTDFQKDTLYYKFYQDKPLEWLKNNNQNGENKQNIQQEEKREESYEEKRRKYFEERNKRLAQGKNAEQVIKDQQQEIMKLHEIKKSLRMEFQLKNDLNKRSKRR